MRSAVEFHRELDLGWAGLESAFERCAVEEFLRVRPGLAVSRNRAFEVERCFREEEGVAVVDPDDREGVLDDHEKALEVDNPGVAFLHCHIEAAAAVDLLGRSAVAEDRVDHMCLDSGSNHRAFDLPRCSSRLHRQRRRLAEAAGCIAAGSRRSARKDFHIHQRWNPRWHARGLFARRSRQRSVRAGSRRFASPPTLRLAIH